MSGFGFQVSVQPLEASANLSSDIRPLSSDLSYLFSVLCLLPSGVCYLSSALCQLKPDTRNLKPSFLRVQFLLQLLQILLFSNRDNRIIGRANHQYYQRQNAGDHKMSGIVHNSDRKNRFESVHGAALEADCTQMNNCKLC